MIYEVGNMIYYNPVFMAEADTTGVVVGAGTNCLDQCRADIAAARCLSAVPRCFTMTRWTRTRWRAIRAPRAERDGGVTRHDRRGHCA
jgi:hypothetical protein